MGGISWSSYWETLISAVIEDAAPSNLVLTFPAPAIVSAADFAVSDNTVSSLSWAGNVLTLVLGTPVIYGDTPTVNFKSLGAKTVTNNVTYKLTLTSTGTGAATGAIRFRVSSDMTLTIDGNGKFYTDSGATTGESATWAVTAGALRTMYVKVSSGTARISFPNPLLITQFGDGLNYGWLPSTNAPTITGDLSKFINATHFRLAGANTFYGNLNALAMTYLHVAGSATITGDIAQVGSSSMYACFIAPTATGFTYSSVAGLPAMADFTISAGYVITSANVNQLLADFWANRNAAKTGSTRLIDLQGSASSGGPTGQGILDAEALRAYSSPTPPGTASLWTVNTRAPG